MAVGRARKQAKWLNLATTPFSWTSKPGAHLGTEKGELMLLAQHREMGRHLDCYNGWKMIFLDCFLGNIGLCLENHSALSIKWRAFLSPPLVTLVCSLVQPPTKKQLSNGASKAKKVLHHHHGGKRPPFVSWASHNCAERELKGLASDSQKGATSTPVTDGLLKQGFEDKANGKDKEEMRCG